MVAFSVQLYIYVYVDSCRRSGQKCASIVPRAHAARSSTAASWRMPPCRGVACRCRWLPWSGCGPSAPRRPAPAPCPAGATAAPPLAGTSHGHFQLVHPRGLSGSADLRRMPAAAGNDSHLAEDIQLDLVAVHELRPRQPQQRGRRMHEDFRQPAHDNVQQPAIQRCGTKQPTQLTNAPLALTLVQPRTAPRWTAAGLTQRPQPCTWKRTSARASAAWDVSRLRRPGAAQAGPPVAYSEVSWSSTPGVACSRRSSGASVRCSTRCSSAPSAASRPVARPCVHSARPAAGRGQRRPAVCSSWSAVAAPRRRTGSLGRSGGGRRPMVSRYWTKSTYAASGMLSSTAPMLANTSASGSSAPW